jgi:hypothetical protein
MIPLTRAIDGATIHLRPEAIQMIAPPPPGATSGAVLTVAGREVAVVESLADVLAVLPQ